MPITDALSAGMKALCRRLHTDSPHSAVKAACLRLLERCEINSPPVPLKPLLNTLDVTFSWSRYGPHWQKGQSSASLQIREGKMAIFIHEDFAHRRWRRTRFSIAHELVHALLFRILDNRKLSESLDKDEESYQQLERLCNLGAAEILMPTHIIRPILREKTLSPKGLLHLYDTFLVSQNSLLWKITSLLPGSCVTRWRRYARHEDEELRPRVVSCYPPYRNSGNTPWLPAGATAKHISPDLVTSVIDDASACHSDEMAVRLGKREWQCSAVATFFQSRQDRSLPLFRGIEVPDENDDSSRDAILFAQIRGSSSGLPWKSET
jgi:hypothetical protein